MSAGTLTLTNNSDLVSGAGTSFSTELTAGDFVVVTVGGVPYTLPVKTVNSNTSLTLVSIYTGPTQSGAAWSAVPRVALNMVTAALVAQSAEALRGLNYDKQNWQQVFSGTGTITVKLPNGTTFSGPSWSSFTASLNGKANKGSNSDITSLSGLTTALSIIQGGTGAKSSEGARTNLGLGSSATRNAYSSTGDMLSIGDFGVGGNTVNEGWGSISPSGFYSGLAGSPVSGSSVFGIKAKASNIAQLDIAGRSNRLFFQHIENGSAGGWNELSTVLNSGAGGTAVSSSAWGTSTTSGFFYNSTSTPVSGFGTLGIRVAASPTIQLEMAGRNDRMLFRFLEPSGLGNWREFYTTANTTKASDGTLKAASPVARIVKSQEENQRKDVDEDGFTWCGCGTANAEAEGVSISRLDVGVYVLTGSSGLASEGWQLLPPMDPGGMGELGIVEAEETENGGITIRLFRRKYMMTDDGEIVKTKGEPIDVPPSSWIDIRLDMPETSIWNQKNSASQNLSEVPEQGNQLGVQD